MDDDVSIYLDDRNDVRVYREGNSGMVDVATEDARIAHAVAIGVLSERIAKDLRAEVRKRGETAAEIACEGDGPTTGARRQSRDARYAALSVCPMIARLDAWSKARQPRADGYYWVRQYGCWQIADWDADGAWTVGGESDTYADSDWDAINEHRILPPE
jgi:hypothetical protein